MVTVIVGIDVARRTRVGDKLDSMFDSVLRVE